IQQEGATVLAARNRQVWNWTGLVGKNHQTTRAYVGVEAVKVEIVVSGEAVLQGKEVGRQAHHAVWPIERRRIAGGVGIAVAGREEDIAVGIGGRPVARLPDRR